jgi:hypothetical protein
MSVPLPSPEKPLFTPGAGPSTPRPGDLSDVTDAIYKLPPVQGLVERAHDEGLRQLRLLRAEWNRASPGERTVMVTMTGVVVGSSIGIILANEPTRHAAFDLIRGRDIPVPLVDGLSYQIQIPTGPSHPDYGFMIKLDVLELLRSR